MNRSLNITAVLRFALMPAFMPAFVPALMPALVLALVLGGGGVGCSAQPPPRVVRLADLGSEIALAPGQGLVVELQEGETIPLRFHLDGPFLQSAEDAPPITLKVRRHCFVRFDRSGVRASVDGQNFDATPAKPGTFRVGLGATRRGVEATIELSTPVPKGLESGR
jgi:hypothetical protein